MSSVQAAVNFRAIENAFKAFTKEAVNLEASFGLGGGPQIKRPTVEFSWGPLDGIDNSGDYDVLDERTGKLRRHYYASWQALLDVQITVDELRANHNAMAYASALAAAFDSSVLTSRWLTPVDVAVNRITAIRPIDFAEDGAHPVSRAVFSLSLNIAANTEVATSLDYIEKVKISSTLEGANTQSGDMTIDASED